MPAFTAAVLALVAVALGGSAVSAQQAAPPLAYDGRGLFREAQATQASFQAVWGDRAAARWVEEHNAALAGGEPLSGPRIVFFSSAPGVETGTGGGGVDAFVGALREQGFEPGQNVTIDWRLSEGRTDVLAGMAADIVASQPAVLVADTPPEILAAKDATSSTPIVFARGPADPVAAGLVQSFDHPGGNVTGLAYLPPDVETRRLGLLEDIVPNLSRVAVFAYAPNLPSAGALQAAQVDGAKLGLDVTPVMINSLPDGLPAAFEAAEAARAQAVMLYPDDELTVNESRMAELALAHRLPVLSFHRAGARAGLLVSSGPGMGEGLWRAAGYAARILRGTPPSELPVGVPYQTDLAINLKTAQALGLTVPDRVIAEANLVIR